MTKTLTSRQSEDLERMMRDVFNTELRKAMRPGGILNRVTADRDPLANFHEVMSAIDREKFYTDASSNPATVVSGTGCHEVMPSSQTEFINIPREHRNNAFSEFAKRKAQVEAQPSNPATVGSGIANVYDISNAKIPAGSLTNTAQLTPEQIAALKNVGADVRQNGLTKDEDMIRELRKRLDEQAILTLSAKVKALEALVTPRTESSES